MMAIGVYAVFLCVTALLTLKVGLMLKRHGEILLRDGRVADRRGEGQRLGSLGRLTLLGFYMVVVGAAALLLRFGGVPQSALDGAAFLATRIGIVLLVLGVTHFHCLSILSRASAMPADGSRRRSADGARPRRAKEDMMDRVFEAARLDAPTGA